jgi:hypothetical protein
MAVERNTALLNHDHSGVSGGTSRLFQINTHQSPDTDSSTSSLHHTLGSGSTQSAAGNHTHYSLPELTAAVFGASNRTVAPCVEVYYQGGPVTISGDVFAGGGWGLAGPNVDTDGMFSMVGGYSTILIPITGRYFVHYHAAGTCNPGPVVSRITVGRDVNACVAASTTTYTGVNEVQQDAIGMRKLTAGSRLYWANWSSNNFTLRNFYFEDTFVHVRYVGPV